MGIGGYIPPNLHIGIKRESGLPHFQYSHGSDSLHAALDEEKKSVSANWEVPEIALYKSSASSRMLLKPDSNFHQMAPNHSRDGFNSSHQTAGTGEAAAGHRALTNLARKQSFILCKPVF